MSEPEDITPDESVAPVFLDPAPENTEQPPHDMDAELEAERADREAGIARLVSLGLTEDEARAVAGGGG